MYVPPTHTVIVAKVGPLLYVTAQPPNVASVATPAIKLALKMAVVHVPLTLSMVTSTSPLVVTGVAPSLVEVPPDLLDPQVPPVPLARHLVSASTHPPPNVLSITLVTMHAQIAQPPCTLATKRPDSASTTPKVLRPAANVENPAKRTSFTAILLIPTTGNANKSAPHQCPTLTP